MSDACDVRPGRSEESDVGRVGRQGDRAARSQSLDDVYAAEIQRLVALGHGPDRRRRGGRRPRSRRVPATRAAGPSRTGLPERAGVAAAAHHGRATRDAATPRVVAGAAPSGSRLATRSERGAGSRASPRSTGTRRCRRCRRGCAQRWCCSTARISAPRRRHVRWGARRAPSRSSCARLAGGSRRRCAGTTSMRTHADADDIRRPRPSADSVAAFRSGTDSLGGSTRAVDQRPVESGCGVHRNGRSSSPSPSWVRRWRCTAHLPRRRTLDHNLAQRWKSFFIPDLGGNLSAVSCPDASTCVAVDVAGRRAHARRTRGGGAAAWKVHIGRPDDPR